MRRHGLWLIVVLAVGFWACGDGDSEDSADTTQTQDVASDLQVEDDATEDLTEDAPTIPDPVEPHVETVGNFMVVYLSGTPYEMGVQQGEMLHDIVEDAMEFVAGDVTLSSIPMIAKDMGIIDIAMENSYPALLEECQGLVDATSDVGFTMDFCLVLNFGDVMLEMVSMGIPEVDAEAPGCSGAIVTGDATPEGRLLHSRNLDWGSMDIAIIHQNPTIFVRQPRDAIPHIYVGFPLNLSPYTGMNMAGIAIGSQEADPGSINELAVTGRSHVQMLGELLKHATTLEEARQFITEEKHMSTEVLVVSDGNNRDGGIFEMAASGIAERSLIDGYAYATNHFIHPDMKAKHAPASTGSLGRLLRFDQLISPDGEESLYGELGLDNLARVMRDPIHPSIGHELSYEELEEANWDIDGALGLNGPMHFVIFDPEKRLFWVNAGILPLHLQPYHCFSMEELLGYPDATPCEPMVIE